MNTPIPPTQHNPTPPHMSKLGRTSKSFIARIKKSESKDDTDSSNTSNTSSALSSGPKTMPSKSTSSSSSNSGESKMSALAAKMSKGGNKLSKSFYLAQQQVLSKTGNAEITQDSPDLALYTEVIHSKSQHPQNTQSPNSTPNIDSHNFRPFPA
eukprot:TRINITY_DN2438_c0_g2_i2.p1 TRINITY_DN2438_c0_g2~~TRINITY_DN2438_c0_g2_i2.p1  ORF type:complete len:154 (-),score=40.49 TRINITY_DN2438_c0_g2_i2:317-778(-)